jgi:hypothetical protein
MGMYERIMENPIKTAYITLKKELHLTDRQMWERFPDLINEMDKEELIRYRLYSSLSTRLIFHQVNKEEKNELKK